MNNVLLNVKSYRKLWRNVFSMTGTVGVPMPTIKARLDSVPEMEYDALANVPRGEICLRGSTLFSGYQKEVLVDGWFHTGNKFA
ncbi:unnamed protein product [Ilex paraguariensis]|uniref:AMP-dependent synthetase/ligase domain-containing protein n=1 Tax=Ilex paraguariensis TaxID=185542 RepID=A0ABC8S8H0_9AQUA